MTVPVAPTFIQPTQFDAQLIGKLNQQGPRYTSYPTADRFVESFGSMDYLQAVSGIRAMGARNPLSLYVHIPFCDTVCYYCACNRIITKNHAKAETYLIYLQREIDIQGRLFSGMNQVEQLHLGGGTPTYLSDEQIRTLLAHLRRWFRFAPDEVGQYAIEVDPRTVSAARVHVLREQGFNRLSLGVQDFDVSVQRAVNRVQSEEQTLAVMQAARDAHFRSIGIDLIYGLPLQNTTTMTQTVRKVIQANPDRIALYNYAHKPELFKPQRRIAEQDLPSTQMRLDMLSLEHRCINRCRIRVYRHGSFRHA